jgi:hypothetical protein
VGKDEEVLRSFNDFLSKTNIDAWIFDVCAVAQLVFSAAAQIGSERKSELSASITRAAIEQGLHAGTERLARATDQFAGRIGHYAIGLSWDALVRYLEIKASVDHTGLLTRIPVINWRDAAKSLANIAKVPGVPDPEWLIALDRIALLRNNIVHAGGHFDASLRTNKALVRCGEEVSLPLLVVKDRKLADASSRSSQLESLKLTRVSIEIQYRSFLGEAVLDDQKVREIINTIGIIGHGLVLRANREG